MNERPSIILFRAVALQIKAPGFARVLPAWFTDYTADPVISYIVPKETVKDENQYLHFLKVPVT